MATISKITLPSGNTYEIKDAYARQLIAGGVSFIVAWNGSSAPVAASIPAGVKVTYNGTTTTGTLAPSAAQAGAFYLVKSSTETEALDIYDEYVVVGSGSNKQWEKLGDTTLNLDNLGELAYKDSATGTATASSSAVTFTGRTTDTVLGSDATFTTTVTPSTTNIKATASGVAVGANGTAAAITALGTPTTSNCLTGVKVTSQPTVSLATGATAGTGVISVATGIASATTTTNDKDEVTAVTNVGTGTAAGQSVTITVS